MSGGKLAPVRVVTASAGTGKTHRLVTEVHDAVAHGTPASSILATTFTKRAAAELVSRARGLLVEGGKLHDAEQLLAGRFGTVNSVFGALLREFAFEGGRSPVTEVIPEERAALLFRMAADTAIGNHADRLQPVAERLGYAGQGQRGPAWPDLVAQVIGLARANGISPENLGDSRERSWAGLRPLFETPRKGETAARLDEVLAKAVVSAIEAIGEGDGTKVTNDALAELRLVAPALEAGRPLSWQQWAKLSKIKAGRASNPALDGVRESAACHPRHPRLVDDVERMIRGIFDCAAEALDAFRAYKLARGLVDFADQEAEALRLLDDPNVARILEQRLELALVDEFQDTSPIQLALFLRLAHIVKRNLWVGDPKQSIYGFRGADPELMSAVAVRIATASGGAGETLATSYRSRPGLVGMFNALFVPAFAPQGISRERAECAGVHRSDAAGQSTPLAIWRVGGSNKAKRAAALASGVRRMIDEPDAWTIVPKGEATARGVRGGDIAILCRTGDTCTEVAASLEAAGLEVALGRDGLLNSAECALALAALRWLADRSDTLALAEIAHLTGPHLKGGQPAWFTTVLSASDEEGPARLRDAEIPAALEKIRPDLLSMTPAEALDAAIGAAGLAGWIAAWGTASQRHANLDALRALARDYEEDRRQSRRPATTGGLVDWLADSGAEKPASDDNRAVVVSTYHGAKGLEWPVTILFQLDTTGRPRLFDQVVAEGMPGGVNLEDPLAGRWLRLWPWPYGEQKKDVGLDVCAAQSEVGQAAARRDAEEAVRLLYVAMTRARDYLVLAVDQPRGEPKAAGLDGLRDEAGEPLVKLPAAEGAPLKVGSADHPCRTWTLGEAVAAAPAPARARTYDIATVPGDQSTVHLPYRFRPSDPGAASVGMAKIAERITLGPRLALTGSPDMASLGDAVHGFLAADPSGREIEARLAMAERLMARWGVGGALSPADVVAAADRLWGFCATQWPGARVLREWPVAGEFGLQRVRGRIDLIVDTSDGLIIIDHKTYPGKPDTWEEKASEYAAQLELYARLCAAATKRRVSSLFVHLPVGGVILNVSRGEAAS